MKHLLIQRTSRFFLLLATLGTFACAPLGFESRADDCIKKVKVKDYKVKVKAVDGKAKIKDKPNGKHKVKVKGPNGDLAAGVAYANAYPDYNNGTVYYK